MEDYQPWIPIVLLAWFLYRRFIAKSRKRKLEERRQEQLRYQQKNEPAQEESTTTEEPGTGDSFSNLMDGWLDDDATTEESVVDEREEEETYEEEFEAKEDEKTEVEQKLESILEAEQKPLSKTEQEADHAYDVDVKKYKVEKKDHSRTDEHYHSKSSMSGLANDLEDFDLRKAIIYQTILERREYGEGEHKW